MAKTRKSEAQSEPLLGSDDRELDRWHGGPGDAAVAGRDIAERAGGDPEAERTALVARTLNDINETLMSAGTTDEMLAAVVKQSGHALGADRTLFAEVEAGSVTVRHVFGLPLKKVGTQIPVTSPRVAEALRTGRPVPVPDAFHDAETPQEWARTQNNRAYLIVPLTHGEKTTGILSYAYDEPRHFDSHDVELSRRLSTAVSLALEKARSFEAERELRERADRELETSKMLLDAARTLANGSSLGEIVADLAQRILHSAAHTRVTVQMWHSDTGELELVASVGEMPVLPGRYSVERISKTARQTLRDGKTRVWDVDAANKADLGEEYPRYLPHLSLFVALMHRDSIVGVLVVDDPGERREFTGREIEFVEGIAAQAGAVVDNARLLQAQEEQLGRTDLLREVAAASASTLDLPSLCQRAIDVIHDKTQAKLGCVYYLDDQHFLRQLASFGFPPESLPFFQDFSLAAESSLPQAIVCGLSYLTDEQVPELPVATAKRVSAVGITEDRWIVVPLRIGTEDLGALLLTFEGEAPFTAEEIELYCALGALLANAIDKARLHAAVERDLEATSQRARYADAVNKLDALVHSSLDIDEVMSRLVKGAPEALDVDGVVVAMREGDAWRHGYGDPETSRRLALESDLAVRTLVHDRCRLVVRGVGGGSVGAGASGKSRALPSAAFPLVVRGDVVGALALVIEDPSREFAVAQLDAGDKLASLLGLALENARLYEVEHTIAETLQETLVVLPTRLPGIEFSSAYESATSQLGRVGGDFVDLFEVRGHLLGVVIGDVSGKGIDAAVITALVRNTVRAHALDGASPSAVCKKTNHVLERFTNVNEFVTMFVALLDTKSGVFRYVSAGHPPALVVRDGEVVDELGGRNPILGAFEEAEFFDMQTVLTQGERVVLCTDGVIEARSPSGGEFFGLEGVRAAIAERKDVSTRELAGSLLDVVLRFSDCVLRDDAALLVIEPTRLPSAANEHPRFQFAE
jgi:GAF domain-containing protein